MNFHTSNNDWNPQLYLKFKNERAQPSVDLVSRINLENPRKIIDIGCGPGNSTQILVQRWPDSKVFGLDNSPGMIEKAKMDYPDQEWILRDASQIDNKEKYDIVFSNATIQWIPDHEKLLTGLVNMVNKNGALAIQLPKFRDMPVGKAISRVARKETWRNLIADCDGLFTMHDKRFYYDLLVNQVSSVEIWETSYIHVMESHLIILDMLRSTGLRPYLERLESEEMKAEFEEYLLEEIKRDYPLQKNGKVLFPFERLFFVAYK